MLVKKTLLFGPNVISYDDFVNRASDCIDKPLVEVHLIWQAEENWWKVRIRRRISGNCIDRSVGAERTETNHRGFEMMRYAQKGFGVNQEEYNQVIFLARSYVFKRLAFQGHFCASG